MPFPARWIVPLAALAAAAIGLYLTLVTDAEGVVWFAYSQAADSTSGPTIVLLTTRRIIGLLLTSVGLLIAAGQVGFRIGRARSTADTSPA